ncbi:MAG: transcriptional activator NhaR [Thiothrix sp.]|uniref:transcriptional activator NhaR n=1 Tax=Thiothrix sp. TaxID=1032 RepID=UPI0026158C82|nr:transcriptional activator NhaR [Thiothrix sp.]MDD5394447.1 transcriptional activator NhaR [Thiothrix sp.]
MLNYKHLYYFHTVANAGSIARASEMLNLTPQTISGQLGQLEDALEVKLFQHSGRNLRLTEAGRVTREYADKIFQQGTELREAVRPYLKGGAQLFRVGVSDIVPKAIAYKLLEPSTQLQSPVNIVCTEGKLPDLLDALISHRMELVIADSPMQPSLGVPCFNHELGISGISFFAHRRLQAELDKPFPHCLDNAPLLLPTEGTAMRNKLRQWFFNQQVNPRIVGEFDDSALMQAFGLGGTGIFVAPTALEPMLLREPDLILLGREEKITQQFFAISLEKRIANPAVEAITKHAQGWLQQGKERKTAGHI